MNDEIEKLCKKYNYPIQELKGCTYYLKKRDCKIFYWEYIRPILRYYKKKAKNGNA